MLSKILGVFTVRCAKMGSVNLILMENTLNVEEKHLKYVFDLKGSTVSRLVKGKTKNTTTLKDVNFLMAAQADKDLIKVGQHRARLLSALRSDVEFLKS